MIMLNVWGGVKTPKGASTRMGRVCRVLGSQTGLGTHVCHGFDAPKSMSNEQFMSSPLACTFSLI